MTDCEHACCNRRTTLGHLHTDAPAACPDCDRIEAGANFIAERLAAAPPAVVDSVMGPGPGVAEAIAVARGDRSLYLSDGNGALYLAEEVDPRHMPAAGPLFRLTAQVPPAERVVDLLEATKASLAASRAYLDAHPHGSES